MGLTRRELLRAGAASGALLVASRGELVRGALAAPLGPQDAYGTSRVSRLFAGPLVVHADLHNHSLVSDGDGAAENAFASMRGAGLDVAALTDHSTISKVGPSDTMCEENPAAGCSLPGLDEEGWDRTGAIAQAETAAAAGSFLAMRGFEWSSPSLGHMNTWFSQTWIDPLSTGGASASDFNQGPDIPGTSTLSGLGMAGFYDWLKQPPSRPGIGGGNDGIAGFNHPGREPDRFGDFTFDPALRPRIVSLELSNRQEDYLFEGTDDDQPSPLVQCLDRGWRVGILGVTDEHGTDWGYPDGKGRAGIYVNDLTPAGVREGMEARRFFATNLKGLRVDAAALSGLARRAVGRARRRLGNFSAPQAPPGAVRMGGTLVHRSGPVTFFLDIDRGFQFIGTTLNVQVLRPGPKLPTVLDVVEVRVPASSAPVISFTTDLDIDDGNWVVLRITDPAGEPDDRADETYAAFGKAIAYASPFYLEPAAL